MRNTRLAPGLLLLSTFALGACSFHAKGGASAQSAGTGSTSQSGSGGKSEFKTTASAHFTSKPRASGLGRSKKTTKFNGSGLAHVGGKFSLSGSASGSASASGSGKGSLGISGKGSEDGKTSTNTKAPQGDAPDKPETKPPKTKPPETKPPGTKGDPKPEVVAPPKQKPPGKAPELAAEPPPKEPKKTDKDPGKKKPDEKPKNPPKTSEKTDSTPTKPPVETPEAEKPAVEPEAPTVPAPVVVEPIDPPDEPPPNAFGYAEPVRGCFEGVVYPIRPFSKALPASYEPLKPISVVYACEWDIPARDWSQGFPGIEDKFEWFAIRYSGSFNVAVSGAWKFRISSDDGTKLFIDGKLVLGNDGVHPPRVAEGTVELSDGDHDMVLEYFQGPRFLINLQLYATPPGGEEGLFSVR